MAIDRELHAIAAGKNKKLIIQMPPRHGKSELCSKYFPAWYLGVFPERRVMLASATDDLAMDFSAASRDILSEHGHLFGTGVRQDRASARRWATTQGGELRAAGVGGDLMGRGADLLIIDDYFKNIEEALSETTRRKLFQWYLTTSETRLSPEGAQILIATRWHIDDLIGMVLKTAEETGEKWKVLSLPAISSDGAALWPERWPLTLLEARKRKYAAGGYPWMFDALYQQIPPDTIDSEWPPHYFADILIDELPNECLINVVALDPSLGKSDKSDYSAFVQVMRGMDGVYYVDANIDRRPSRKIVDDGIEWMKRKRPNTFGCEAVAFQELLCEMFSERISEVGLTAYDVYKVNTGESPAGRGRIPPKLTRIRLLTPLLAAGRIKIKRSPGSSLLLEQLKGFPAHKHDDGPDALEMGIRLCNELLTGTGYEDEEEVLFA